MLVGVVLYPHTKFRAYKSRTLSFAAWQRVPSVCLRAPFTCETQLRVTILRKQYSRRWGGSVVSDGWVASQELQVFYPEAHMHVLQYAAEIFCIIWDKEEIFGAV